MAANALDKALLYTYDPDEEYVYDTTHSTEYPYNAFPLGMHKKHYKKTRFKDWMPVPEDVIMRHSSKQIIVNFKSVFGESVISVPEIQIFQMRSRRPKLQNIICEQISFFCALYDPDNDLITSMLVAKHITDSQTYTINTFNEYFDKIYEELFPPRTIEKIEKMVDENDVGDDVVGLFDLSFLRDTYIVTFQMKILHIFIEHFILSTGNSPTNMYELFAHAYTETMNKRNENMYVVLYRYVSKAILNFVKANSNICDMQALQGVTITTLTNSVLRKELMCNGLIKLTFASEWDYDNKRPAYSCVGLIKSVINSAASVTRKVQLRYSLATVDDVSQILDDSLSSASSISAIRSFNPGQFVCMTNDLNSIIGEIALATDLSPVDFYMQNLPQMNDLSAILIDAILYNRFHSTVSTRTISQKQRYILLLYVRDVIMHLCEINEYDSTSSTLINLLTAKTVTSSTKTLTKKDLDTIYRYASANKLSDYLLSGTNVQSFIQNVLNSILSSYTIVNHNDPSLLDKPLIYESSKMMLDVLDAICKLFEWMNNEADVTA